MQTFRKIYKEELKKLIIKMDKRHSFYMDLEKYKLDHGQIPDGFSPQWTAWLSDGRKYWKKVPGVFNKIKKSARKTTKNRIKNEKTA